MGCKGYLGELPVDAELKIITLDEQNLGKEDICCALADKKNQAGVSLKKDWLRCRFREGLKFKKLNVRGKVFIEYLPAEKAWKPVHAPGYLLINCLWVAGSHKGQGYGARLLEECINDSKDTNGIVVISTSPAKPFTTDKKFFQKYGFEVCDRAPPYFELLVRKNRDAESPRFEASAKAQEPGVKQGLFISYADQCPFTAYYVNEMKQTAEDHGIPVTVVKYETMAEARNAPCAFGTFNVFYEGRFLSHEIMSRKKLEKALGLG